MNFQVRNKQWKFILIAVITGIISAFLSWIIISAFGINIKINDFKNWLIPALLTFIAITAIVYAILLLLFVYNKKNEKEKGKPGGLKKSISIPVVSITKSTDNTKYSVSKIPELEKLIQLKKTGIISDEQFRQLKSKTDVINLCKQF